MVATLLEHNANVDAVDGVSYCDDVYTNGVWRIESILHTPLGVGRDRGVCMLFSFWVY